MSDSNIFLATLCDPRVSDIPPPVPLGATTDAVLFGFLHVVCVVYRTADARCFQGRRRVRAYCVAECTRRPEVFGRVLRATTLYVPWTEPVRMHHVCGVNRFAARKFFVCGRRRSRARVTAAHVRVISILFAFNILHIRQPLCMLDREVPQFPRFPQGKVPQLSQLGRGLRLSAPCPTSGLSLCTE
jgi:hypothetical protein